MLNVRQRDTLSVGGEMTALKICADGLPRKAREPIQEQLKRLQDRLLKQALARNVARVKRGLKPRDIATERLLVVPYEYKDRIAAVRREHNLIPDAGEAFLVDAFQGLVEPETMKFHGIGTTNTAPAEANTALAAELTTVYNPANTRATGSLTEGATADIFRTVGTNTVQGAGATIVEWGLFAQAAVGGGTMWSRVVFTGIALSAGDSLQTTYDLTVA